MERHSVKFVNLFLAAGEELRVVSLNILSQSTKSNMHYTRKQKKKRKQLKVVPNAKVVMKEAGMEKNRQNFLLVFLMQH